MYSHTTYRLKLTESRLVDSRSFIIFVYLFQIPSIPFYLDTLDTRVKGELKGIIYCKLQFEI
mgnify:CR=1 FL=1